MRLIFVQWVYQEVAWLNIFTNDETQPMTARIGAEYLAGWSLPKWCTPIKRTALSVAYDPSNAMSSSFHTSPVQQMSTSTAPGSYAQDHVKAPMLISRTRPSIIILQGNQKMPTIPEDGSGDGHVQKTIQNYKILLVSKDHGLKRRRRLYLEAEATIQPKEAALQKRKIC